MDETRRPSMADVAAAAGVSGQTVSRVVNAHPRVDPATRARVEEAMAALGYRPHRAARALRTGRSDTIGVVVSTLASVGNSRMLQAIADSASARGFALTIVTARGADAVAAAFARLHEQGVDGAIVLNEATAAAQGVPRPGGLALVVVDAPAQDGSASVVETDHAAGARAATDYLLARGRVGGSGTADAAGSPVPTVHHLAGPEGSFAAAERERGWREALLAAGRPVPPVLRGDWTAASGYDALRAAVDRGAITALFAANDQLALGALRALAEQGRRIPGDVAVVGFDDVADAADYRPPLTTVRQDFDALGAAAVDALLARIAGQLPAAVTLTPTLVIRTSA